MTAVGTYRGFISRAEARLVPPRSRSRNIRPEGSLGHWAGGSADLRRHSDCAPYWRRIQRFHMETHDWVDVAYTVAVCDHGYVFAGRGAGVRTAANGTNDANGRYYAIFWMGGQGETPSVDAVAAWWQAWKMLGRGRHGWHSQVKGTVCPGPDWKRIIAAGPSGLQSIVSEEEQTMKNGDTGEAVRTVQRALMAADANALPKYGADGDFGDETEGAVKEWQAGMDLPQTGVVDGVVAALLLADSPLPRTVGGTYTVEPHSHTFSVTVSGATEPEEG